ncbi:MAG: TIGR02996 domain-containing protein [Archangium sp.]|nr:TIGR02996 domain-containing protein [Archangium sp.]
MEERALIEAIREAPGDDQRWAVYADQLESRGDVRGQLIALALAGKRRAERLLRDKRRAQLGSDVVWQALDAGVLDVTWRAGHFERVRFLREATGHQVLRALLDSPLAMALAGLDLRLADDEAEVSAVCDVLSLSLPPLRSLEISVEGMGTFAPGVMLSKLTRLEHARLFGVSVFDDLRHGRLESLRVWFNDWEGAPPCLLGALDAPRLVELTLRTRFDSTPPLTRWVRERCHTPSLRRLFIEAPITSQLVEAIADAPFANHLERLELLVIDDASAHTLLERRSSLPRLVAVKARFFRTSAAVEASVRAAFTR